jgi:hypothetical protein
MAPTVHQLKNLDEQSEVLCLGRVQWRPLYEWHDLIMKINAPPHTPPIDVVTMVVVTRIPVDGPTSEELLQNLKRADAARALGHDELWTNLPAEPHRRTSIDVHAKAALSVDEPRDPAF